MINPYTGQDDDAPMAPGTAYGAPPPYASAPPAMPPPPMNLSDDAPMAPGTSGGAPPELAQAMQTLQQADTLMGPGAAGPAAGGPAPGMMLPTPAMPPTLQGQQQALRQQQFGGLAQSQQLDTQQVGIDQQAAAARMGGAQIQAGYDADRARIDQQRQDEQQQTQAFHAKKQVEAQAASQAATEAWAKAKPADWFDKQEAGTQLAVSLGIALAHIADQLNAGRGIQSNIGQQAVAVVNQKIEQYRAQEIATIEKQVKSTALGVDQAARNKSMALAQIEDKYAGIQKSLELQAKSELSKMGMDSASVENAQVVIDRKRKTLEQEQRRLDALNGFVDREIVASQKARKGGGGGKGTGSPTDPSDPYAGMNANQRDLAKRKDEALAIPNLDGSPAGKAKSAHEAEKIRAGQEATAGFVDNLNRLKGFIEREGTIQVPLFEQGARDERQQYITSLAGNLTIMNNTGVLNDGEYKRYNAMVAPKALVSNAKSAANLDNLAKAAEEAYARKVRSQGIVGETPAEQGPTTPATLPAAKPAGTSKFSPKDVQMMQWIQQTLKMSPTHSDALEAADYLKRKYGAASGL